MNRAVWGKLIALGVAVATLIVGLVLLQVQAPMTEMHDADAFEERVMSLYDFVEKGQFEEASKAFHELRGRQDTGKNAIFDLGAGLASSGAFVLLVTTMMMSSRAVDRFVTRTHGPVVVFLLVALFGALISFVAFHQILLIFERFGVPPWADSLAIPLAGVVPVGVAAFLLLGLLAGAPHLAKRVSGVSLLEMPSKVRAGTVVALVVYGALTVMFLCFAALFVGTPGGWISAPTMIVAAWLMLHARAVTAE